MRSVTLVAALLAAGCSLFGAEPDDRYALTRVNGVDLPVTLSSETRPDGRQRRLIATSGSLTFYSRGTYRMEVVVESEWSGVAADTAFHQRREGTFTMLADTVVQVRFPQAGTWSRTNYRILESGNLLRAVQDVGATGLAVYDYRKQD